MKVRLRSSTTSPKLFLRRNVLLSSTSDHHAGYGLVDALISMNAPFKACPCLTVPLVLLLSRFDCPAGSRSVLTDEAGSTCTISSQVCTMLLIREVLPLPAFPATSTFNLPIRLPRSVKGRLDGMLMLGMTSCGPSGVGSSAPTTSSCRTTSSSPSSSLLEPCIAWLPASSMTLPSSSDNLKLRRLAERGVPVNPLLGCALRFSGDNDLSSDMSDSIRRCGSLEDEEDCVYVCREPGEERAEEWSPLMMR